MLIIDDRLLFRVLRGTYAWLPEGHDPSELATTTSYQYRLLTALLKGTGIGVHSQALKDLSPTERRRVLSRAQSPEPLVAVLDPRSSLSTSALVGAEVGRFSYLQAEFVGAAMIHNAALAVTTASQTLIETCFTYAIPLHQIQLN
jgi:hypothetical protein